MTYDVTSKKFIYTDTSGTYSSIYFLDEYSASFCGFDINNPSSFIQSKYIYNLTSGTLTSQLDVLQAGWVPGLSPRSPNEGFNYSPGWATSLIKEARLFIGGQIINRITGDYIVLKNNYDTSYENQAARTILESKNDNSIKYKSTTSFIKLPFDLDNIPACALKRNDIIVEVDFGNIKNYIPYAFSSTGNINDSTSYNLVNLSTTYNVPDLSCYNPKIYKDTLFISHNLIGSYSATGYMSKYNINSTFTGSSFNYYVNNPGFTTDDYNFSNGYAYKLSGNYLQRISIGDLSNNLNTSVVSSVLVYPQASIGSLVPNGSLGYPNAGTILTDSRYVYVLLSTVTYYLPISGIWFQGTQWYSGSRQLIGYLLNYTGAVSGSSGVGLELVNALNSGYPGLVTNIAQVLTQPPNSYVLIQLSNGSTGVIGTSLLNAQVVRYDTFGNFNNTTSYSAYTRQYTGYSLYGYPLSWGAFQKIESDGRYFYIQCPNGYLWIIDTFYFLTSTPSLYSKAVLISSLGSPLSLSNPWNTDGKYIYTSYNSHYISRLLIGTTTSWQTMDISTIPNYSKMVFLENDLTSASSSGFDGQYMYWCGYTEYTSPVLLRYDTTQSFTSTSAYSWISKHWAYRNNPYNTTQVITGTYKVTGTGNSQDVGNANNRLTCDSLGNYFVLFYSPTNSLKIYNTNGTQYGGTYSGRYYLVKYNSSGLVQWVVYSSGINFLRVKIDSLGNIYLATLNSGTVINSDNSVYTPSGAGLPILIKLSSSGICTWNLSGTSMNGFDVTFDSSNNPYLLSNMFVGGGTRTIYNAAGTTFATATVSNNSNIIYLLKSDTAGAIQWGTVIGSMTGLSAQNTQEYGWAVLENSGTVYVTESSVISSGVTNGYLETLVSATGVKINRVTLGPTGFGKQLSSGDIVVDSSGNIYAGAGTATTYVAPYLPQYTVYTACYLYKLTSALAVSWTVTVGGVDGSVGQPMIKTDSGGNIIILVASDSSVVTVTDSTGNVVKTFNTQTFKGIIYKDSFLLKFTSNGVFLWGVQFKGELDEIPLGLAVDNSDNIYCYVAYSSVTMNILSPGGSAVATFTTPDSPGEARGGSINLYTKFTSNGTYLMSTAQGLGFDDKLLTSDLIEIKNGVYFSFSAPYMFITSPRYYYLVTAKSAFDPFGGYYPSNVKMPSVTRFDPLPAPTVDKITYSSLVLEYSYIGKDEMTFLTNVPQSITYKQIQTLNTTIPSGTSYLNLPFLGPISEIYINSTSNISAIVISFNQQDLVNLKNNFFKTIQPYEYAVTMPYDATSSMYKFSPSVNFSRISYKVLALTVEQSSNINLYAHSFNIFHVKDGVSSVVFDTQQYSK
jgi:hypothetical protein